MSGERFSAGGEDWEEQMLDQLVKMFQEMGMNIDQKALRDMMEQIKSQLDDMGVDPEKMASGKVDINLQASLNDIARMMGAEIAKTQPETIEITTDDEPEKESEEIIEIPNADIYQSEDSLHITIDCGRIAEIDDAGEGVELSLTQDGTCLNLMLEGRPRPVRRYRVKPSERVEHWELNNGILDVTLKINE